VIPYIYDNEDILLELDGQNNITARYTHGPGIDEPLILEKSGQSFFYHADGLGSITELTDASSVIAQRYTYSSFGKIESELDPTFIQPYTFTAREFDIETGLYFYRARTYDPSAGRFLQEDPVRGFTSLPQSLNRYLYVGNTPLTYTDPVGLINLLIGSGFSAVVGGGVEGAAGVIINPGLGGEQADIGVFGSVGAGFPSQPGGGINVSAEYLFFGYITGDAKGWTTNYNYAFGPISVTVFTDPVTGDRFHT